MAIRCNNAPELKILFNCIIDNGGSMELAVPYTPEQNSVAERINRTIIEKTKAMLIDSGLPYRLWPEVIQTASYLCNRTPVRGEEQTPKELWSGKKPDLAHLQAFGYDTYNLTPKERCEHKLGENSKKSILIGYGETATYYRLWDSKSNRIFIAMHIDFNEKVDTQATGLLDQSNDNEPMEREHYSEFNSYETTEQGAT
jgi:hypothetical protein